MQTWKEPGRENNAHNWKNNLNRNCFAISRKYCSITDETFWCICTNPPQVLLQVSWDPSKPVRQLYPSSRDRRQSLRNPDPLLDVWWWTKTTSASSQTWSTPCTRRQFSFWAFLEILIDRVDDMNAEVEPRIAPSGGHVCSLGRIQAMDYRVDLCRLYSSTPVCTVAARCEDSSNPASCWHKKALKQKRTGNKEEIR